MVCVFGRGHAFEKRRTVALRDVLDEPLVTFAPDTPQGRLITDWCNEHQLAPRSQIEVRSGQAACALAAAGAGMSITDDLTARAWQGGKLGYRPLGRAPAFEAFAVHNTNFPPSVLAQAFVERVKAGFKALRRSSA